MDIWEDRFIEVCRRHRDLVAVYESPRGRLALLLRQTLVPLGPEHFEWLAETRATARAVIADLRVAGFDGATVVLQWLPFGDVASIVARWVRRWDGDQVRRTQLLAVVDSHLADQRFLDRQAYRAQPAGEPAVLTLDGPVTEVTGPSSPLADGRLSDLRDWYAQMAPCWLAIEPLQRRRLVLQTHAWIAERVLSDRCTGSGPGGRWPRARRHAGPTAPEPRAQGGLGGVEALDRQGARRSATRARAASRTSGRWRGAAGCSSSPTACRHRGAHAFARAGRPPSPRPRTGPDRLKVG